MSSDEKHAIVTTTSPYQLPTTSYSDTSDISKSNFRAARHNAQFEGCEASTGSQEQARLEKRLVRKLDLCLLPVLILMCLFQAIDKSLIGYVLQAYSYPAEEVKKTMNPSSSTTKWHSTNFITIGSLKSMVSSQIYI